MSDTRPWWPPGYGDDPAFQVRRQVYGAVTGGDYVRGSSVTTLVHTALRYPTEPKNRSSIENKSILHVRPKDHSTVEIQWGWPPGLEDNWLEVALVRSAFGRPSTVNDGQTVFRAVHDAFLDANNTTVPGPIVWDQDLPAGRWYHYGLFFKVTEVEWLRGMVDSCLLPRDLGHKDHLWNNVPPYYRWVDDNYRVGDGYLRQFLSVFAFELDTAREFVESWQHLYDIDWSPIRLLRNLGPNFGLPYEQGVGDIRYRSLLSELGHLYEIRGTARGLQGVIRDMSKFDCQVIGGSNLALLPDDSDFLQGTGSWAGVNPETMASGLSPDEVFYMKTPIGEVAPPVGRGSMRIWSVFADATSDFTIALGDGVWYAPPDDPERAITGTEIVPLQRGIPVQPGASYGFSCYLQTDLAPVTVELNLVFFGKGGQPDDDLATAIGQPTSLTDTDWSFFFVEGQAPDDAFFVAPIITFTNRVAGSGPTDSPYLHLAGVMVYKSGEPGETFVVAPDRYLTMGDPGEVIGGPDPSQPSFDPFIMGAPKPDLDAR